MRRLVAMGPNVLGARNLVGLDPDELIATAIRSTGLGDFGAGSWEEPFRRLVAALNDEAHLHVLGRLMTRNDLLRHLQTRLIAVDAASRQPAIAREPITAPVFVTGPARSGTSILHELLGEDPALRAPLGWEMAHPLRPESGPDERAQWAESEFDLWADVSPPFAAVHELAAHLPEECIWLFAPDFDSAFWATCTSVPSFLAWRAGTDPAPSYRFHRLMLQVLQHEAAQPVRPWALKSPVHLPRLPALFAEYPDARVIVTHRDPVRTVPSAVSTLAAGRMVRSDAVDVGEIAASIGFGFQFLMAAAVEQRPALPADQIADLHYLDLMRDPVNAISRAYEKLNLPFGDELPERIRGYLAARPQNKHGTHSYRAADYGLDVEQIRKDFLPYTEAFGVEYEPG